MKNDLWSMSVATVGLGILVACPPATNATSDTDISGMTMGSTSEATFGPTGDPTQGTSTGTSNASATETSPTTSASASSTLGETDTADTTGTTGGDPPPPSADMPAGIPTPSFGYQYDTTAPATIWVDNTNPDCDNAQGTKAAPLCDLFAGSSSVTYAAGDIVSVAGGPYTIDGDLTLRMEGTASSPVVIRGEGQEQQEETKILFQTPSTRADLVYQGSYGILENIEFLDNTKHVVDPDADHLVFHRIEIHNPDGVFINFNPVFNVGGEHILIYESMIYDNRRDNDTDSHGIQAGSSAAHLWILDNELYNNNGDAFQGCHQCFEDPPHHVYIGRNLMHEDRENAVDLKTIHDVVVSENVMWGYVASQTSSGDAVVIGSNGYDDQTGQGPRNVWVLNNEIYGSTHGLRIEGVQDVWILGNEFYELDLGLQIDDKEYRDVVIAANVFDQVGAGLYSWNDSCSVDSLRIADNIISNSTDHHIEVPDCPNLELSNNLIYNPGGLISVRIGGPPFTDAATLNGQPFADGNVDLDPLYGPGGRKPMAGSPAIDGGVDLEPYYDAVEAAYGGDARFDRAFAPRPAGAASDIGAYEQ